MINFPQTILFAVLFIEAVLSTIQGLFPPNSRVVGVKFSAAAFATNFPTNHGANEAEGTRNSPSLANIGYHPFFTREGGVPTLEMQILVPIQEVNEFNHNILDIVDSLKLDLEYVQAAQEAYQSEINAFVITRALACFERTLISGNSLFDRFLEGDESALTESELSGYILFNTKGCNNCHSGDLFTNFEIVFLCCHCQCYCKLVNSF